MERKEVAKILKELQDKYGESVNVASISGKHGFGHVEWLPIDSPSQADLVGQGYPKGRMIEIFGGFSCGKTTLACYIAGQVQKAGGTVGYIDFEQALDPVYAKTLGLNVDEMFFCQPDNGEQGLDVAEDLIERKIDVVIIDSTAAITPAAELNGEMGDHTIGAVARLLSKACRKMTAKMSKSPTILIWISQTRTAIGSYAADPEISTGGSGIKFFSSVRIKVSRGEPIKDKAGNQIGMMQKLKTVKNKVAAPMRVREVKLLFGKGYQTDEEYYTYFEKFGIIKVAGAGWITMPDGSRIQGRHKVIEILNNNPEMKQSWIDQVKKKMIEAPSDIEMKLETNITEKEFTPEEEKILMEGGVLEIDTTPESTEENKVISFGSQESSSRSEIEEE